MEEMATIEDFEKALIKEYMPDDILAQEALKLSIQMMRYSVWLATEHKKADSNRVWTPSQG